uniref:Uncharacterized protein n=1 Tax=Arundo donax TaxID=35708 RepID=A0A0A9CCJ9_ARUDO
MLCHTGDKQLCVCKKFDTDWRMKVQLFVV